MRSSYLVTMCTRWPVVAVAVAVVLSGCADVGRSSNGEALVPPAGFRAHRSDPGGGMDAVVAGVVEVDLETGCVWLSDPSGARYPVVWPAGTSSQSDPLGIVLRDGQLVAAGDRVEGSGGYVDADAATAGSGMDPFPQTCVQVGEAAVFNPGSPITVTEGVGLDVAETLVGRFSPPQPIGLELIAVDAVGRSVAVVDFVTGTVHRYESDQYEAPADAIDGASGGGGFVHVWASGTIHTYWPLDSEPLVFQPDPLRHVPGVASALEVLPAPDGDRTWLVQPGFDENPTLIELVDVVGFRLARLTSTEIEGSWQPAGATVDGLVLVTDESEPVTRLVSPDGTVAADVGGTPLSVEWNGAAVLRPDGSLIVTDASLGSAIRVEKPAGGGWASVGGPVVPATSPPVRTGADEYLVMLADEPDKGSMSAGDLIVVDAAGVGRPIYQLSAGSHLASLSRGNDWVVVVEEASVTLISIEDGSITPLGPLIPESHYVLTAG